MNKKAIWMIIGLMSAALLGIGWLQVNWITYAVRLNEEEFNYRVIFALNQVVERLELQEQLEAFKHMDNGFARSFYEQELLDKIEQGEISVSFSMEGLGTSQESITLSNKAELWKVLLNSNNCDCTDCKAERAQNLSKWINYNQNLDYMPVAERIHLDQIRVFLKQELRDQGINIDYKYGIYDNKKRSFVIANNHFVVEDAQTQPTKEGYKNLYTSTYRVNLFQQDVHSPGMLMVYFPTKTSFVWGSVLKTLIGSILFTGIILFCFIYTIQVIFRQKKLSEMKSDFINNMTHEFKTPIATISLATDSITSPMILSHPDKVKRFAGIIKQENKRMNNQVEKVLQMAQLEKKDYNLKLTDINLHEVVNRAIENITLQVERKGGTAVAKLKATNPMIQGDVTHISNIVNNLLDNANKYSPEKPEISVQTRNVSNGVQVIVSDKGIGMSKEAKKHIFDKFYRVHTGNLHDVKGFGLGLSYVKAMMNEHKGQIDVKSELGEGSSFILTFLHQVE